MTSKVPDMVIVKLKDVLSADLAAESQVFEDPKVVAFKPQIAHYLGSIEAALYFQQLSHWQKYAKRSDGYFYKTAKEMEEETCISEKKQRRCREQLVAIGWLDVKKVMANGSPTYHFKVLVRSLGVLVPTGETPVPIGQNASSITKNTHEKDYTSETRAQALDLHRGFIRHFKVDPDDYSYASNEEKAAMIDKVLKASYRLTPKRLEKVAGRLEDAGYDMCKKAILNLSKSEWHKGKNENEWEADLYEYLFRSYENVEKWATK